MKAKDLMIGDWVLCDMNAQSGYEFDTVNYQPYQIANGEDIDYAIENNKIGDADVYQPILLTPEILEKNGFEKRHMYYVCTISDGFKLWYYPHLGNLRYEYKGKPIFKSMDGLNYVHQLQHALRLCGIEKEIEI